MTGKVDKVADRGDRTEGEELGSQRDSDDEDYNFRPVENVSSILFRSFRKRAGGSKQKWVIPDKNWISSLKSASLVVSLITLTI